MKTWLSDDWIRAVAYDRLTTILQGLEWPEEVKMLEWAEREGIIPKIVREVTTVDLKLADYPAYDIQDYYPHWENKFDALVADQVLEHVPDIFAAVTNCIDYVKHSGIIVLGTPWLYPYHAAPKDFWRISRDAYQWFFDNWGIETIEIGGWGHQKALIYGNQQDAFLSAVKCIKCGTPMRDPHSPCPKCGGVPWEPNRTVEMAKDAGLFDEENSPDHAIEIWAVGRKI